VRLAAFVTIAHQPGMLEDTQMLGDGRLRYAGLDRHYPDRLFSSVAKPLKDGSAGRVGKRPEERVVSVGHAVSITLWL
jgi:hypothetical protein